MRLRVVLIAAVLGVTACGPLPATLPPDTAVTSPPVEEITPEPMTNPYAPQPADAGLTRGKVFIQETGLLIRESYPPQIVLGFSGDLPDPCHQLRVQVSDPDENNRIDVEAYSVANPEMACIQVLQPFQAEIDLGTFPSGHYSVWLNGELAGEFDS